MNKKRDWKIEKWSTRNGNVCFRFQERDTFEKPWIMYVVIALLAAVTCIEYFANGTCISLYSNSVILCFIFLWWINVPLKSNEKVIEKTMHELMDGIVARNAEESGIRVVKSKVHYDVKGTYGIIKGRFFLVLLDDGSVWEYPISYHPKENGQQGYYECSIDYIVSENVEHIKAFKKKVFGNIKLSDKTKMSLLLVGILFVGGLIFFLSVWLILKEKWWILLCVVGYFVLCSIIGGSFKGAGRFSDVLRKIMSIQTAVIYIVLKLVHPFITITGTYFFVAVYAFGLPAAILTGLNVLFDLGLHVSTIAFVVMSFGSILCAHSYSTTKMLIRQTPLRDWENHQYESFREELAIYLIHPSNVIFLLYFMYFVFLLASGYAQIQNETYLVSKEFDVAILKAFLVFIAFTNMRSKAKDAEMDVKSLLGKILLLFVTDDYGNEKEGQEKRPVHK